MAVEIKSVKTTDFEIEYATFGNGSTPFVILPGLSVKSVILSAGTVEVAYADIADAYKVYLFDRPKPVLPNTSIEILATQTAKAMQLLNISSACVFGASQGGMIAQYIAINHPNLISKLVLGSTLSKINSTADKQISKWIEFAEKGDAVGLYDEFCECLYSDSFKSKYKDMFVMSASGVTSEELQRFVYMAKACDGFDVCGLLKNIKADVLVIGVDGDKVVSGEASKEIADILNCDLYMYDNSYAHAVFDEAEDYKQRLLNFFNK